MSTFSKSLQEHILQMRKKHPGWGPTTLLAELKTQAQWANERLPSRSTLAAFLRAQGLSRKYEPNSPLPAEPLHKSQHCHDLWQVDGQGTVEVAEVGPIAMLNVKDIYGGIYVCVFPARLKSTRGHPNTTDYQMAMRLAFMRYGLPKRLQFDHASVFHENNTKSPFPTKFFLWLLSLGIEPCFSRVHRPTDQAKVERAHRTIFDQVLRGRDDYKSWEQLYEECEKRRTRLNESIPSRSTDNVPPLEKHPQARYAARSYHLLHEPDLIDLERVHAFLEKGKWYRKVASNRTISLGRQIYYLPKAEPMQQLEITFRSKDQVLVMRNAKQEVVETAPLKGITKESLMGDLELITKTKLGIQLKIPFDWATQKVNTTLSDCEVSTT